MTKVHIASSRLREIGNRCIEYASANMPEGFELSSKKECDIFISVLYDKIVDRKFIGAKKCFNFHPGVLPDYRGAGAYSWVLLNKEKDTGVTLHEIDENIDSGNIIDIQKTLITEHDTAESLFFRCMDILYKMFKYHLPSLLYGTYSSFPNEGGKVYYRKDLQDAKDLTHMVKAFTFSNKENAYYYNQNGEKVLLKWTQ